jgi:hypothetical protein
MSPKNKSKQKKNTEAIVEECSLVGENKYLNRNNFSKTSSYIGLKNSPQWEEIYWVFKEKVYLMSFGLQGDEE